MRARAPAGARKLWRPAPASALASALAKPEPGFSRDVERMTRALNLNDHLNSTSATGLPLPPPTLRISFRLHLFNTIGSVRTSARDRESTSDREIRKVSVYE